MRYTLLLLLIFFGFNSFSQAPTLTLLNSYELTPNTNDTIGAFARLFYYPNRNKFYSVYAARQAGSSSPSGMLSNFAWREYDQNMIPTGITGSLSGQTGAGDYAMVMVDSNYYHLTLASPSGNYKLTKYDDDFNLVSSVTITLNSCSSNIDQLMNYTNERLIIGAMMDSTICPPVNPPSPSLHPYSEINQYDLNLNPLATSIILQESKVTWGSSMVYNAGFYYEITMQNFNNRDLYAFKYDSNFNYISKTLLNNDAQWSQGVLFDNGYYYVAHHVGDHNHGNVVIGIYDSNWVLQNSTDVTNYTVPTTNGVTSYNSNRPFLTKVGDKLYVAYDVEKYIFPVNQKDWQSNVKVYQINSTNSILEKNFQTQISVSPNPVLSVLTISSLENTLQTIQFFQPNGQLVFSTDFEKEIQINVQTWEKGVYYYKTASETGKIIIE